MKKVLSLVLALVLLLSVSAAAFAEEEKQQLTDTSSVDVYKQYKVTAPAPDETFKFTVTPVSVSDNDLTVYTMPSLANTAEGSDGKYSITFAKGDATAIPTDGKFTIDFRDKFNRVGTYTYEIKEDSGNTAGVEYDSKPVRLVVTVLTDDQGKLYHYVTLHKEEGIDEDGNEILEKVGGIPTDGDYAPAFTNTFTATTPDPVDDDDVVTALRLQKLVTGNYGDTDQYFDFKVVFTVPSGKNYDDGTITVSETSYAVDGVKKNPTGITKGEDGTFTATFKLKANETLQFGSVPVGMNYMFEETDSYGHDSTPSTNCSGTVEENKNIEATITNNRDKEIPTGISLDSLPYVIILATVAAAAVLIVLKKKASRA